MSARSVRRLIKEIEMNTIADRYTEMNSVADKDADTQKRGVIASRGFAICFGVFLLIALCLSAWLIVSTGVPDVSAAAADARPTPPVPYFPSLYDNQATKIEPQTATF